MQGHQAREAGCEKGEVARLESREDEETKSNWLQDQGSHKSRDNLAAATVLASRSFIFPSI
jgi:hypothetical protein